ncbi:MAG: signal transduction histidine kinase [Colwellia sp.]|jgi:signal transduction histidine kinase
MSIILVKKNDSIQRKTLVHAGKLHTVHWLILSLSILLTISAWYFSSQQATQKINERFKREAAQVIELVKERIALYEQALWGAVAFYHANDYNLNAEQWKKYATSLHIDKTYPGINGIGVIYNIKPDKLNDYLIKQRVDQKKFTIHPTHQQPEHWPITYIEPLKLNEKSIGLDVAFEYDRYTAIKKSRDTGLAQLTGPIILTLNKKKTDGFYFYAPFYNGGAPNNKTNESREKNIIGVIYSPVIMHKLISGTLAIENRLVSLKISDEGDVLYDDSDNDKISNIDKTPLYQNESNVNIYGRVWRFNIDSNLAFRKASETFQPLIVLLSGIFIDFLILGLFLLLSRANRQALVYSDAMTCELRARTQQLLKSNQDLEQFAYVASHDLKSPLNAIRKLVSWLKEDCIDTLPQSSLEHIALLENRTERMSNLLDDLLNYARIERFDYQFEKLQLSTIADNIFSLLDHDDNVSLITARGELYFPKVPLEIILRNLISNAIKHHDKEIINIIISYSKTDQMYCISIQDDGPGIPPTLFHKALEMFQTLKPRDKVEGSGMGLSLVQRIILHYKGQLTIESDGLCGTKIIIMLPIQVKHNLIGAQNE